MTSPTREAVEEAKADFALVSEFFPVPWKPDERTNWIWTASLKGGHAHMADVRGWGYLTGGGHGALNLDANEAAKIQDAIGRLIVAIPALLTALQAREEENARLSSECGKLASRCLHEAQGKQALQSALAEALGAMERIMSVETYPAAFLIAREARERLTNGEGGGA